MTSRNLDVRSSRAWFAGAGLPLLVAVWCAPAVAQETFGTANYAEPAPPARPDPSDWDRAFPVPAGHHLERRSRHNLIVESIGAFSFIYAMSAVVAASAKEEAPLWVPVVGPFIQIARSSSSNSLGILLLSFDGIMQSLAAGMIAYGVAVPRYVLVRDVGPARVSIAPAAIGGTSPGLSVVGIF